VGFFKKTIRDVELDGKRVLVRVDYNVPLKDGKVDDDLRIKASLPTLKYLLERGCDLVLISHLGRPEGWDLQFSLEPAAIRLGELLDTHVEFVNDIVGDAAYQTVQNVPKNSIVVLQNVRFDPREEEDSEEFARAMAHSSQAEYFVQDGFAVVHRAHASTHAITLQLPSVCGLLVEQEYKMITKAVENPTRPLVTVLGGAKVSDKIHVIERFVKLADTILIGGAMANTFLNYRGVDMGASKVEDDQQATLDDIYDAAHEKVGENADNYIILPTDVAVAREVSDKVPRNVKKLKDIEDHELALDIGTETIDKFCEVIEAAGTVIWNGPMGIAEYQNFAHGSARIALSMAMHPEIHSIIGGGDTADFALKWDVKKGGSFTHVSTGGGAGLDLMAGKKLPGVESLLDA
jgi:3-phosphoglycerate kinase